MAVRIKLPGGTLKVKVYRELRGRERERRVPVMKVGSASLTTTRKTAVISPLPFARALAQANGWRSVMGRRSLMSASQRHHFISLGRGPAAPKRRPERPTVRLSRLKLSPGRRS
ncbi:MAG: hypothetical protein E5Y61_29490 [Mesorhizobium sp.]|nr:MAG: hypothetical protein E5Y61_29490 [Mesorhizobium sp.]